MSKLEKVRKGFYLDIYGKSIDTLIADLQKARDDLGEYTSCVVVDDEYLSFYVYSLETDEEYEARMIQEEACKAIKEAREKKSAEKKEKAARALYEQLKRRYEP